MELKSVGLGRMSRDSSDSSDFVTALLDAYDDFINPEGSGGKQNQRAERSLDQDMTASAETTPQAGMS